MTTHFEEIYKNNRYEYARVSSKEQAENSSLDAQKAELMKMGVLEENISIEVGSATDSIIFKFINQILKCHQIR